VHDYALGPDGLPLVWSDAKADKSISAFVCGREVAPETGSLHLQGYLELKSKSTLGAMLKKSLFKKEKERNVSVRLEVARGTAQENIVYCSKEDPGFAQWGEFTKSREGQGKQTHWHLARDLIKAGATNLELFEQVPQVFMPHQSKVSGWRNTVTSSERSWNTRPVIFFGPTRTGKTVKMKELATEAAAALGQRPYYKTDSDKWWPKYSGESIICIEEMDGSLFTFAELKRFFDASPLTVQTKGGDQEFLGKICFMSTNRHPSQWYPNQGEWDETNPFYMRIKEFGELWVFSAPLRGEDNAWMQTNCVRDLSLAAPAMRELVFNDAHLWPPQPDPPLPVKPVPAKALSKNHPQFNSANVWTYK